MYVFRTGDPVALGEKKLLGKTRCSSTAPLEPINPAVEQLIARLEEASAGDRELDATIHCLIHGYELIEVSERGGAFSFCHKGTEFVSGPIGAPYYTASTDVGLGLIPDWLVEPCVEIQRFCDYCNASISWGSVEPFDRKSIDCTGRTLPLAVCVLALRARQAVPPTGLVELSSGLNTDEPKNNL